MNISNYYWYFQSAIPERICDMIVKYGKSEKERQVTAITGGLGRDRDLKSNSNSPPLYSFGSVNVTVTDNFLTFPFVGPSST